MNIPKNFPRFVPLKKSSANHVFYYDSEMSLTELFEAIESRLIIAYSLLFSLHELKSFSDYMISTIAAVATSLLDEIIVLLQEFNPIALQLRREKEQAPK